MTYDLMKTALNVSALRQETISSNISNVNTPDYKANYVEFEEFLKEASNGHKLTQTNSRHLGGNAPVPVIRQKNSTSAQDNGNNVDIDYEMAELSANNIYYDAIVSQLNAKYSMIRTTIK